MKSLESILEEIGLTKKESNVYRKLLELGSQPIGVLSKHTAINRSTCYSVIKTLLAKGLISKYTKFGVQYFTSLPISKLPNYLEDKKNNIDSLISDVKKHEDAFRKNYHENQNPTSVSYFEGIEGVKYIYEDTLKENSTIRTIVGLDEITDELNDYLKTKYLKKRLNLNVKVDAVISKNKHNKFYENKDEQQLRTKKILPYDTEFTTQISIYDNKVAYLNFSNGNYKGVIIQDKIIYENMMKIFLLLKKL